MLAGTPKYVTIHSRQAICTSFFIDLINHDEDVAISTTCMSRKPVESFFHSLHFALDRIQPRLLRRALRLLVRVIKQRSLAALQVPDQRVEDSQLLRILLRGARSENTSTLALPAPRMLCRPYFCCKNSGLLPTESHTKFPSSIFRDHKTCISERRTRAIPRMIGRNIGAGLTRFINICQQHALSSSLKSYEEAPHHVRGLHESVLGELSHL